VLSICLRIYVSGGKASHTVVSTAAATVRQAVALVFDHAVLETSAMQQQQQQQQQQQERDDAGKSSDAHAAEGREMVAALLLQDLLAMVSGVRGAALCCACRLLTPTTML
jgi:precorrin-6B methylase 2